MRWKSIFNGKYEVSEDGMVRRASYIRSNGSRADAKVLSQSKSSAGYFKVNMSIEKGKQKPYNVHRLISMAFLGDSNGLIVDHIDGDKLNNSVDNLRYVTYQENSEAYYSKANPNKVRYVSFVAGKKPYVIRRKINGVVKCFGSFKTMEEAKAKILELFND